MDAGALRTVNGQTGTLVLDVQGQDSSSVLDASQKEELHRMTINFPTYDYVVTLDAEQVYVVKRSTVQE
ncbi:uncharacterized protein KRP23_701 [Phytophthora ramorum]|uniref:uncharacterized protein n=1 Tax=Phytophthora ramorum TaxID=164328 RepID=UPI00309D322A|nr:hypothetical protein KRP23_701 [Phytophthora ramorum]